MSALKVIASMAIASCVCTAYADCVDDKGGIDNSASVDGEPLEGYSARTPQDFASAAISRLYTNDPNNTVEKIVAANAWAIISDGDRWADIAVSAVTGNTLPPQPGVFYNNNFAVCADNGQCAQVDFQINFVREDNVSGNFVNYFMDAMLSDLSQNGAWDSTVTIGMPHTYDYNVHGYTAIADLAGEIDAVTVPSDTLRETIETMGALATPSSYGTAAEQAAMQDKTCRDNEGNPVDSNGEPIGGGSGGSNDPPDSPWEGWQEGIPQEQCWWIITEQGNYSNC